MVYSKERSEEIINKITEAIKRKSGKTDFKCPVCTNNQFSLAGGFTTDFLVDKVQGGLVLGGPVLPSVPIVCTNCGNTFFLNAKVLGVADVEDQASKGGTGDGQKTK